jgi:PAS domain-containing protein
MLMDDPRLILAASIAPSFAAAYNRWQRSRLAAALRRLGFRYVAETAVGAYMSAQETARYIASGGRGRMVGACPAVVSYIEKYRSNMIPELIPVASPVRAHARHIRKLLGPDARVVFIGPCIAKKNEATRADAVDEIAEVLTFEELNEWFEREDINLKRCEESAFDEYPPASARCFPLEGGALHTAGMSGSGFSTAMVAFSGWSALRDACDNARDLPPIVEPLFCEAGCINGAGMASKSSIASRRMAVLSWSREAVQGNTVSEVNVDLSVIYTPDSVRGPESVPPSEIERILAAEGKSAKEDRLDCGACGYDSCRDHAAAVALGLAESQMCMPCMRKSAEGLFQQLMEESPMGILVLDEHLHVVALNSAACQRFSCSYETAVGVHIGQVTDPDSFDRLAAGEADHLEDVRMVNGEPVYEIVYAARKAGRYMGMFLKLGHTAVTQEHLTRIRQETVQQARELYRHQIDAALTFARWMGEYTARGEALLDKLIKAVEDDTVL